jgi:hypothetical protein
MRIASVAVVLAALTLVACANAGSDPVSPPASSGRYGANATVLDDGTGPVVCLGGVAESLPPQCGGMPVLGWSWDEVDGEDTAGGVTWGEYHVVGTYDGSSFTVEQTGPPEAPQRDDGDPFETPCPEPTGGWTNVDPSATGDADRIAAMRTAESIPEYAGLWISYLEEPSELEPGPFVLNVAFTGDPASYEADLRAVWGGPLCVLSFERTFRELRRAQDDLSGGGAEAIGLELLWSGVDVLANQVEIGVVVLEPGVARALDDTYGRGTVRVVPALRPV